MEQFVCTWNKSNLHLINWKMCKTIDRYLLCALPWNHPSKTLCDRHCNPHNYETQNSPPIQCKYTMRTISMGLYTFVRIVYFYQKYRNNLSSFCSWWHVSAYVLPSEFEFVFILYLHLSRMPKHELVIFNQKQRYIFLNNFFYVFVHNLKEQSTKYWKRTKMHTTRKRAQKNRQH